MQLPDFLCTDDGGFIHARGHRIGLHHVVRLYADGYSPEMVSESFPTLPLALIHKIIAFYLENRPEVGAYVAEHDREIDRQASQPQGTPTLAELHKRHSSSQIATRSSLAP